MVNLFILREERKKEKIKKRMQMTEQGSAEEREKKEMRLVCIVSIVVFNLI